MPESKSGKDNWLIKLLKETKTTLVRGKFAIIGVTLPAMALLAALIRWGVPLKYIAPIFGIVGLIYGKLFEFYKVKRMNKEFKTELKETVAAKDIEHAQFLVSLIGSLYRNNHQYIRDTVVPKLRSTMLSTASLRGTDPLNGMGDQFIAGLNDLSLLLNKEEFIGNEVETACNELFLILHQMLSKSH